MKKLLLFGVLIFCSGQLFGQTNAQALRLARATYEQGRLHDIKGQLDNALKSPEQGGFKKEEKQLRVEALKILCLSYIYLEEPQKADETMLRLKKADPYYRPNPEVDPAEFVALYNSFREEPIFRIGPRLGINFSRPNVVERITVIELAPDSEFKNAVSFYFGGSFGLPLNLFKQQKKWTLHADLLYQQYKFEIDQKEDRGPNPNDPSKRLMNSFSGFETQHWISLPVLLEYTLLDKKYHPYVSLGVGTDYLLTSNITGERTRAEQAGVSEKTEDFKPQRENLNLSILGAAGIKLPLGPGNLVFEVRYAHGLTNVSSPETAFANQSFALDYGYSDSVYKLSSLNLSGSFIFNKFNPKKLNRKK